MDFAEGGERRPSRRASENAAGRALNGRAPAETTSTVADATTQFVRAAQRLAFSWWVWSAPTSRVDLYVWEDGASRKLGTGILQHQLYRGSETMPIYDERFTKVAINGSTCLVAWSRSDPVSVLLPTHRDALEWPGFAPASPTAMATA